MRNFKKTSLLIFLLAGWFFILAFLYLFGKNTYQTPKFYPLGVDTVIVNGDMIVDSVYHTIPDFELIDSEGEIITHDVLDNSIYVADFFFTTCPSICPKMTNKMAYIQSVFKKDKYKNIKFISFTVNPDEDTPEVLANYADLHNAEKDRWYFVTGEKKKIYDLARNGYFLVASKGDGGEDDFIHSNKFVLVDQNRIIRGYFDGTDDKSIDELIGELRVLHYETE